MEFYERFTGLLGNNRGASSRLSEATGASKGLISAWKSGEKKPSLEYIAKIADFFNVSADYLLGKIDDPTKKEPTQNNGLTPAQHKAIQEITMLIGNLPEEKLDAAIMGFRSLVDLSK